MTALLDAQAARQQGIEFEGPQPAATEEDNRAIEAWNLLSNGTGGLDWTGLPYVVAHLGVDDPQALIQRLLVIKTHKPPDLAHAVPPPDMGGE